MPAPDGADAVPVLGVRDKVAKFVYLKVWPLMLSILYGWCGLLLIEELYEGCKWRYRDYLWWRANHSSTADFPWLEVLKGEARPGFASCVLVLMAGWIFPFGKSPRSALRGTGVMHRSRPVRLSRRQKGMYGAASALCFTLGAWLLVLLAPHAGGYRLAQPSWYFRDYEFFPGLALLWLSWVVYPYEGQWDGVTTES